ncbi:MAG: hypothetical protein LBI82_10865 [Dysgonamonadaceae bacterium]|jgi:gas vesicle protein|nr:hypothetical protein [Dysgonamonadaceae bacterium]
MKSGNSKLILGLVIGAAVGAAACYLMNKENREELLDQINETVDRAKKKIGKAIDQGIEELDCAVDKVNTLAQTAVSRVKAGNIEAGDE